MKGQSTAKFKFNRLNRVKKIGSVEIANNFQNSVRTKEQIYFYQLSGYLAVIIRVVITTANNVLERACFS